MYKGAIMKVKTLSIAAGPDYHHDAGTVLDLPEKKAKELIDGGFAVAYEPEPEVTALDVRGPRTPPDQQAGEFGRRGVIPQTTSAKHAHAEETVKVEHEHKHK
jgi:hypothetical protein